MNPKNFYVEPFVVYRRVTIHRRRKKFVIRVPDTDELLSVLNYLANEIEKETTRRVWIELKHNKETIK